MATSDALREIFTAARPLVEQWLDVAEQIGALREVATNKGLDWSQVKALLKAQIQDERDEAGDGKRVRRIVEKAEFASAYADMLGLANMNEKKYFADDSAEVEVGIPATLPAHDPETGEIQESAVDSGVPLSAALESSTPLATRGADESVVTIPEAKASEDNGATVLPDERAADSVAGDVSRLSVGSGSDAPISDAEIPAFLKADHPQPNPRCQRLTKDCKHAFNQHGVTCSTCGTAWAVAQAQRKARAAA